MTYLTKLNRNIYLSFIFIIISACSSSPEKQDGSFDLSSVNNMLFRFQYPEQFFATSLTEQDIATQVTNNLAEWGYNISVDDEENRQHEVFVKIGAIKHQSTPAGFSFSIGNSDPRALEFQKADVLPITCFLSPRNQPEKSAELTMVVEADDYLSNENKQGRLSELLVDDLSTVCFNLLSNLKVKTQTPEVSENVSTPGWIPSIRVEEVEDSTDEKIKEKVKKASSTPREEIQANDKKLNEVSPEKKQTLDKKESRKRIIIHNQGSPIIFKFGHERK